MKQNILVAYSSKYGATAEIAERIAAVLEGKGFNLSLAPVKKVGSLEPYQAVILGSAVYFGLWRREAVRFLKDHEEVLRQKQVWFFSSGPAGEGDPVELLEGWTFPAPQEEIAARIQPRDKAVFHGAMDPEKMNFFERWILKRMEAPTGDFRDWTLVEAWAERIAGELG